ncbi:MAG: biopolymer transporter ExbD [Burkholderiales bacterium]|nr:MAG: biopolymer transporter ExbD [Burkholderiales bacterium]
MAQVNPRSKRGRRSRLVNEMNVVPYIDVMLVLLVIFMVTAPLIPTGVIDLPRVGQSNVKPDAFIEVVVRANGELVLRTHHMPEELERPIGRGDLPQMVGALRQGAPGVPVVVSGERQVAYEEVTNVLDDLQSLGVGRVGLMVKPSN